MLSFSFPLENMLLLRYLSLTFTFLALVSTFLMRKFVNNINEFSQYASVPLQRTEIIRHLYVSIYSNDKYWAVSCFLLTFYINLTYICITCQACIATDLSIDVPLLAVFRLAVHGAPFNELFRY